MRKARQRKTTWQHFEIGKLRLREGDLLCVRFNPACIGDIDRLVAGFERLKTRVPVMFIPDEIRLSVATAPAP